MLGQCGWNGVTYRIRPGPQVRAKENGHGSKMLNVVRNSHLFCALRTQISHSPSELSVSVRKVDVVGHSTPPFQAAYSAPRGVLPPGHAYFLVATIVQKWHDWPLLSDLRRAVPGERPVTRPDRLPTAVPPEVASSRAPPTAAPLPGNPLDPRMCPGCTRPPA